MTEPTTHEVLDQIIAVVTKTFAKEDGSLDLDAIAKRVRIAVSQQEIELVIRFPATRAALTPKESPPSVEEGASK